MSHAQKAWSKITAKAWSDEAFRRDLLQKPSEVLTNHGIAVDKTVMIHENTAHIQHFVLPEKPSAQIMEMDLSKLTPALNSGCDKNSIL